MSVVGMPSGGAGEAAGLPDAVALGQVVEDGDGGLLRESAAV
jgi:hypothetical protein